MTDRFKDKNCFTCRQVLSKQLKELKEEFIVGLEQLAEFIEGENPNDPEVLEVVKIKIDLVVRQFRGQNLSVEAFLKEVDRKLEKEHKYINSITKLDF